MEEKFEEKVFEYKLKSLIKLRTALMQILTVLIGGIVGLSFTADSKLKHALIIAGIILAVIFAKSLASAIREFNKIVYRKKKKD